MNHYKDNLNSKNIRTEFTSEKGIKFNLPNFIISIGYCFSDVVINFETRHNSYTLRIIGFPKFHRTKNMQSIDPCLCEQKESEAGK